MDQLSLFDDRTPPKSQTPVTKTPEPEPTILTPMPVVAKVVGIGLHRLFAKLREDGVFGRDNLPYQKYISCGFFQVKKHTYQLCGSYQHSYTSVATSKGVDWLIAKYQKKV